MATGGERVRSSSPLRASTIDERRALLQRVLWSRPIERSARVRDFLAYVCERTLLDPEVEIHEQEIGCRVFGRRPDYDTAVDNVVRVTATLARKKLEQYFSSDGASEPWILEIPKGQYTPVFREQSAAVESGTARPASPPGPLIFLAACAPLLGILALWACVALWMERKAARSELETSPSLNGLWSQLLPEGGAADLVVMDSSLSLFQELQQHQLTLAEYLQPGAWMHGESLGSSPALKAFVRRTVERRLTSLGGVTTAFRIAQLAASRHTRISILSPRDFNIRQMKSDNVILLGSSIANPWVNVLEDRLNFRFGFDKVSRFAYFENRNPRPSEAKTYTTDAQISYCQIAFLPNPTRTGSVLLVSGAEVEGTEGGGEFVTSERSLAQLRSLAGVGSQDRLPYLEALLKSSKVGGATPGFTPVALRIVKQ